MSAHPRRTWSASLLSACMALALAVAGTALGGAPSDAAAADAAAGGSPPGAAVDDTRLIVRLAPGVGRDIDPVVTAAGGEVVAHQPALDTVVVDGPSSLQGVLEVTPQVVAVSQDRSVTLHALGFDPATQAGSLTNITRSTGATAMWQQGITGAGVDVALIDTGVAPVPGLSNSLKVVVGPDLSFDSQSVDTRHLDGYGHGTAMAGIIAGREVAPAAGKTYAADTRNLYGMAPDARLISIKVGDQNGAVDVSQIIAAIGWVAQYGTSFGLNVRVLNLSLGLDSAQDPKLDPLSWAAETAWHRGVVVVVAAGNSGGQVIGLTSPAYNPTVIAVGAQDTRGTTSLLDDVVPAWSTPGGGPVAPYRNPDVVAPGVRVVSLGVAGSILHQAYPGARIGNGLLRGSGTSQAAAVVSGAAALLLQQRPSLTPEQVKTLLTGTAQNLPYVNRTAQGAGAIDLVRAAAAPTPGAARSTGFASGTGRLEAARGGHHLLANGVMLTGEVDVWGGRWSLAGWTNQGSTFNGSLVAGAGFTADTVSVAGRSWAGRSWAGRSWAGSTWSGRSWATSVLTGRSWAGNGWSSTTPLTSISVQDETWASNTWTTSGWG